MSFLSDAGQGWHALPMGLIRQLLHFARTFVDLKTARDVCNKSLLAGGIAIRTGEEREAEAEAARTVKKTSATPPKKKVKAEQKTPSGDDNDDDNDEDEEGLQEGDVYEPPDPEQIALDRQMARAYGEWSVEAELHVDCASFAIARVQPVDAMQDDDDEEVAITKKEEGVKQDSAKRGTKRKLGQDGASKSAGDSNALRKRIMQVQPELVDLDQVEVEHRKTVIGSRHEWRVWRQAPPNGAPMRPGGVERMDPARPSCIQMLDIIVFGSPEEMPNARGEISSLVKRIWDTEWQVWDVKRRMTMLADQTRAQPRIVTQRAESKYDAEAQATMATCEMSEAALDALPATQAVHQRIRALNTQTVLNVHGAVYRHRQHPDDDADDDDTRLPQARIDAGQEYVPAPMPEVPLDSLPFRQSLRESIGLAYGIPLSMLSSGDATGRSKLNAETASPETARIFREAQGQRKRRVEERIRTLFEHAFGDAMRLDYVQRKARSGYESEQRQRREKRRKTDPEGEKGVHNEDRDDGDEITPRQLAADPLLQPDVIERATAIDVSILANPQAELLVESLNAGYLKYAAFVPMHAAQTGFSLHAYRRTMGLSQAQQEMQGCAPDADDDAPDSGSGNKKKKQKKA